MRLILALVFVTFTAASSIHFTPATTKIYLLKTERENPPKGYHEQDSGGFYSYGYSGDRSAKAEYITVDGSSKGFYSYIDADGKLQTVKYEAGRKQGFKAEATNLPKLPKTSERQSPKPVKDTIEVQLAKKAHFEAYREAELRAALATAADTQEKLENEQVAEDQGGQPNGKGEDAEISDDEILTILAQNGNTQNGNDEEDDDDRNGDIRNGESDGNRDVDVDDGGVQDLADLEQKDDENNTENVANRDASEPLTRTHKEMTTYTTLNGRDTNDEDILNLRTVYSIESENHKNVLRLPELTRKSSTYIEHEPIIKNAATYETVRVPIHSYYTVLAPKTKYSVITPTTFTEVPREESLKRGHSLPISLSSIFSSHRIKTKTT